MDNDDAVQNAAVGHSGDFNNRPWAIAFGIVAFLNLAFFILLDTTEAKSPAAVVAIVAGIGAIWFGVKYACE